MKLKRILTTTFLASILTLGVGLFVANNTKAEVKPAEATVTQESEYYFVGSETSWNNGTRLYVDSENTNKGQLLNKSMTEGQTFKFKKETTWDGALGWDALNGGGGSAKTAFKAAAKDGNIEVAVTGIYHFYITSSDKIYVEFTQGTDVYVQLQGWTNTYVYAFDESTKSGTTLLPLGGWPGTKVSTFTAATNFNGSLGGIAKISVPYHTLANTKIIVNNGSGGSGGQSGDQPLGSNYYYTKTGDSGSASDGAQAKVVFDIESAIEGATNKSVCAVSKSTAATLVSAYDALGDKTKVNASTYYTWKSVVDGDKENHTYVELVSQLRRISTSSNPSNMLKIAGLSESSSMMAIVIVSVLSITALGGYFFFRKSKHEND